MSKTYMCEWDHLALAGNVVGSSWLPFSDSRILKSGGEGMTFQLVVRSLNINGLYRMSASSIHAQVVKMKNLEELHVGDILFLARQFSSLISRLSKLKKLSLSWTWVEVEEITAPGLVVRGDLTRAQLLCVISTGLHSVRYRPDLLIRPDLSFGTR